MTDFGSTCSWGLFQPLFWISKSKDFVFTNRSFYFILWVLSCMNDFGSICSWDSFVGPWFWTFFMGFELYKWFWGLCFCQEKFLIFIFYFFWIGMNDFGIICCCFWIGMSGFGNICSWGSSVDIVLNFKIWNLCFGQNGFLICCWGVGVFELWMKSSQLNIETLIHISSWKNPICGSAYIIRDFKCSHFATLVSTIFVNFATFEK